MQPILNPDYTFLFPKQMKEINKRNRVREKFNMEKLNVPDQVKQLLFKLPELNYKVNLDEFFEYSFILCYSALFDGRPTELILNMNEIKILSDEQIKEIDRDKNKIEKPIEFLTKIFNKPAQELTIPSMMNNPGINKMIDGYTVGDYLKVRAELIYKKKDIQEQIMEHSLETFKPDFFTALLIYALCYKRQYNTIDKIMASVYKRNEIKMFTYFLEHSCSIIVENYLKTKGIEMNFIVFEEDAVEITSELINENNETIENLKKLHYEEICNYQNENAELHQIIKELKRQLQEKENELKEVSKYSKFGNKSIVLLGDVTKREKYEEVIRKFRPQVYTFLDPFENRTKIPQICGNADIVLYMTDRTEHNVTEILKKCRANLVLIPKSTVRDLEEALINL